MTTHDDGEMSESVLPPSVAFRRKPTAVSKVICEKVKRSILKSGPIYVVTEHLMVMDLYFGYIKRGSSGYPTGQWDSNSNGPLPGQILKMTVHGYPVKGF